MTENVAAAAHEAIEAIEAIEVVAPPRSRRAAAAKIGIWYVCKRCCEPFDTPSAIERHQSRKRSCNPARPSSNSGGDDLAVVRYRKAIADFDGNSEAYLRQAVKRGIHAELKDVLNVCNLADFELLLKLIAELAKSPRYTSQFFDLLAMLSDYSNGADVSLERKMRLKAYVDYHITL